MMKLLAGLSCHLWKKERSLNFYGDNSAKSVMAIALADYLRSPDGRTSINVEESSNSPCPVFT